MISVIIPVWNAPEHTAACLRSLAKHSATAEIVVVDNGSDTPTATLLDARAAVGQIRLIRNERNLGFAAAVNQGLQAATGQTLIVLNSDTVVTADWDRRLAAALTSSLDGQPVGAAGPRSNNVSGTQSIVETGISAAHEIDAFARRWATSHAGQLRATHRLVGFCLALSRQAYQSVGDLDTGYGIGGFEDDDLSQRLAEAGFALAVVDDAFVFHAGSVSFRAAGTWESASGFAGAYHERKWSDPSMRPPLLHACGAVHEQDRTLFDRIVDCSDTSAGACPHTGADRTPTTGSRVRRLHVPAGHRVVCPDLLLTRRALGQNRTWRVATGYGTDLAALSLLSGPSDSPSNGGSDAGGGVLPGLLLAGPAASGPPSEQALVAVAHLWESAQAPDLAAACWAALAGACEPTAVASRERRAVCRLAARGLLRTAASLPDAVAHLVGQGDPGRRMLDVADGGSGTDTVLLATWCAEQGRPDVAATLLRQAELRDATRPALSLALVLEQHTGQARLAAQVRDRLRQL